MNWQPKKVVVPVDFSDESFRAVDFALDLVTSDCLHVVHVLSVIEATEPGVIWGTIDNASRARHAEQALRERLAADGYREVHLHVAFGDPGHGITELAEELAADLIVLPSHGRTGLSRLLIGSVAEKVVRLSRSPVLVLKQ